MYLITVPLTILIVVVAFIIYLIFGSPEFRRAAMAIILYFSGMVGWSKILLNIIIPVCEIEQIVLISAIWLTPMILICIIWPIWFIIYEITHQKELNKRRLVIYSKVKLKMKDEYRECPTKEDLKKYRVFLSYNYNSVVRHRLKKRYMNEEISSGNANWFIKITQMSVEWHDRIFNPQEIIYGEF